MKILSKISSMLGPQDKAEEAAKFVLSADHLKPLVPFNEMSEAHLVEVMKICQVVECPARKKLFKRGQEDTQVHYLLEGSVDLFDENFNSTSLKGGDSAGTYPLDDVSPHQMSAITTSESILLQFDRDRLDLIMTWEQAASSESGNADDGAEDEDWMSALLESELFNAVPPAHIQQLFATFKPMKVAEGDVIVQEGQEGDRFYVIAAGKAVVSRRSVDGDKALAELTAGRFFGEEALIGETTRNASITMASPGRLMYLDKSEFKKLLEDPVLQSVNPIQVEEFRSQGRSVVLLDVRLSGEYRHAHDEGSINIPLNRLRDRMEEFARERCYIVSGNAGRRSELGVYLLISAGFQAFLLKTAD